MMDLFALAGAAYYGSEAARNAAKSSARAESKAASTKHYIARLEANLAKALLISEALWEIVRDNLNLTDEQLRRKIQEVDMRDGTLDGKNRRKAVQCPSCGHTVSARHPACLYCGQVIDDSLFTVG